LQAERIGRRHRPLGGLALLLALSVAAPALAGDWTLARQENGITVHTRPVADSGIDEFRGVAEVGVAASEVLALVRDSDRFKEWFPNTTESKLLDRDGAVSHQYSVMDAPWPVSERDNVFRSVMSRDEASGTIELTLTANPDHYPEQDGRVRVRHARGSWRFEPLGPTRTRITFQMHLDPGGGVPQWLMNARVVDSPFEALTNLRAKLGG
jgi:ribosome-associated toxin RatA of RatAB toxin-antitoxin module